MPAALRKPCAWPRCPELVHRKDRYCREHEQQARKSKIHTAPKPRISPRDRGYDKKWDRFSIWMRQKYPVCQCCDRRMAQVVDHIVPKSAGGITSEVACWTLCKQCHDRKTARFDGGTGKVSRIYCGKHAHNPTHMYLLKKHFREVIGHEKDRQY